MSDLIATAVQAVPRQHYADHPELGSVPQSTAPAAIERDLARAGVQTGMRVMEIGTGTDYTGALLAEMVGPDGHVVSIDIDPSLTDRAGKLHAERGVSNITLVTADGHQGAAQHGPYDVIVGWATPTHIPSAWVAQCAPGGRIATPVYIAPAARTVGHVTLTINDEAEPVEPKLGPAVYVDMGSEINTTLGIPLFYVDASTEEDPPAWVSVAWRDLAPEHDPSDTLVMLQHADFSQKVVFSDLERDQAARWRDFRAYCVGREGVQRSNLTAFGTGEPYWITAIGFSSGNNAAVLTAGGGLVVEPSGDLCEVFAVPPDRRPGWQSLHSSHHPDVLVAQARTTRDTSGAERAHRSINAYSSDFIDRYLKIDRPACSKDTGGKLSRGLYREPSGHRRSDPRAHARSIASARLLMPNTYDTILILSLMRISASGKASSGIEGVCRGKQRRVRPPDLP